MEKYKKALHLAKVSSDILFDRGMDTDGYSQLVGALNVINIIAADDSSIGLDDYKQLLHKISAMRSAALKRLVNNDEDEQ